MAKKKSAQNDYSKIGENISSLMEICGVDASELSKQTGIPSSTISRLRSMTSEVSPNLNSLVPIANYFKITLSQLIGEEPINKTIYEKIKPEKTKKIPIPILNNSNIVDFLETKNINNIQFITTDVYLHEGSFAFYLQGNAMEPQFPEQTLLIIDQKLKIENLDYVLALPVGKNFAIFRQIFIEGEEKYLRTLNPTFNEFIKINHDSHKILGVMVQSRRTYRNVNSATVSDKEKLHVS